MAVQVIRASKKAEPSSEKTEKTLRVAAYCRVSTGSEEQENSYDVQVSHYTSFISANPSWTLVGIYADEGISGTSTKNRSQFNRMMADCEKGKIDLVITKSISRWARNTVDSLNSIRKLKGLGIAIYFEKESINTMDARGEILITIMSSIAQEESRSISKNVSMGIRYHMQQGKRDFYVNNLLGFAKDENNRTVIVKEEANLVRRIYREYLSGYSPGMIAAHLTKERIKTPARKETWYQSTVISILANEKYCGDFLMQKYYVKDFLSHRTQKNTGQLPQYFAENDHAPIVPKKVFLQVQGEMQRRSFLKNDPTKIRFGSTMALSGRLYCSLCGRTLKRYTGKTPEDTDWRCRRKAGRKTENFHESHTKCRCRTVPEMEAKRAVVEAFNRLPMYRDELLQQGETARLAKEEKRLLLERTGMADRELSTRFLLELVDGMGGDKTPQEAEDTPDCRDMRISSEGRRICRRGGLSQTAGYSTFPTTW